MSVPKSMALRLSATLGLIALVVFAAAGALLYRALASELRHADLDQLLVKAAVVRHFVDEARSDGDLTRLAHHLDDALIGQGDLRVWLLSDQGEPIYGGSRLPATQGADADGRLLLRREDGEPMEGVRAPIAGAAPLPISEVLIAIDVRPRQRLLGSYAIALGWICTLGVLLVLALGAAASWRGLLPVRRLSAAARKISPAALGHRLPLEGVDSELTDLTRAFNSALDRVEHAYRQMEAFNADVAHELRTPLTTLINGTQLALSADRSAQALKDLLASNLEDLERLKVLVNDMLFLARADQGDKAQSLQQVELADEAEKSIEYFEAMLHEQDVGAVCEGRATVSCNPALVRRALVNLLSNALRYTDPGGTITIRIEATPSAARIAVHNPGAPLPPSVMQRMFDRFFRAEGEGSRTGESQGLGLAIVRAIARMHDGDVFVESGSEGVSVGFSIGTSA